MFFVVFFFFHRGDFYVFEFMIFFHVSGFRLIFLNAPHSNVAKLADFKSPPHTRVYHMKCESTALTWLTVYP